MAIISSLTIKINTDVDEANKGVDNLLERLGKIEQASSKGYRSRRCDEYIELVDTYVKVVGKAGLLSGISIESKNLMAIHDQNERMVGGQKAVEIMAEARA